MARARRSGTINIGKIGRMAQDMTLPEGLVYQIQFASTLKRLSIEDFGGLWPVYDRITAKLQRVYTVGMFRKYDDAVMDHDGCVGADYNTQAECHCKTPDGLTTPDCDCNHRKEGGYGGVEGTGEGGVKGGVHRSAEVFLRVQAPLLTDAVEDNHVIVDGVTDDGEDSCNEGR